MDTTKTPNEIMRSALIHEIKTGLEQCTDKQQDLFYRLVPLGADLEDESIDSLKNLHGIVQRTIIKNSKKAEAND